MKPRTVGLSAQNVSQTEMLRMRLISASQEDGVSPTRFFELLEALLKKNVQEELGISLSDLVKKPPPIGMGLNEDDFKKLLTLKHRYEDRDSGIRERMQKVREAFWKELTPSLRPHGGDRKSEEANQLVPEHLDRGTTNAEYIRARLKDNHPDLFAQVINEEITAAEGARRAGIAKRKRRTDVYPDDINHTARVLLRHFDPERLCEAIRQEKGEPNPSPDPTNGQMSIGQIFRELPASKNEEPWPKKPKRSEEEKRFYQISQWMAGLSRFSPEEVASFADDPGDIERAANTARTVIAWFERYAKALEDTRRRPLRAVD